MFTRFALALVVALSLTVAAGAADLPTGTWAANVDGNKGDLVIKEVKAGQVTGVLLGTDFTTSGWNGKTLVFAVGEPLLRYEAHLITEPGEKGKTKYTLTGTRVETVRVGMRRGLDQVKTGWYAQITADTPVPVALGEIKVEVRGVLVYEKNAAYVSVKRKVGVNTEEARVWVSGEDWKSLKATLSALDGKEVVATGRLAQSKGGGTFVPEGGMYFLGTFDIKLANPPK
jgi:hypothetical protein